MTCQSLGKVRPTSVSRLTLKKSARAISASILGSRSPASYRRKPRGVIPSMADMSACGIFNSWRYVRMLLLKLFLEIVLTPIDRDDMSLYNEKHTGT